MKRECCHPRASRGFAALIEILIVAALIVGGLAWYLTMSGGSSSNSEVERMLNDQPGSATRSDPTAPRSIPGRAIRKAQGVGCDSNLNQCRMLVMTAKNDSEDGNTYPPSLSAIPETAQVRFCPVGKREYTYDPATGEVHCPFPGHEKF